MRNFCIDGNTYHEENQDDYTYTFFILNSPKVNLPKVIALTSFIANCKIYILLYE